MVRTDRKQVRKAEQRSRKRHKKQAAQYPGSKQETLVPFPYILDRCGNVSGDLGGVVHVIYREARLLSEYCEEIKHRSPDECALVDPRQTSAAPRTARAVWDTPLQE